MIVLFSGLFTVSALVTLTILLSAAHRGEGAQDVKIQRVQDQPVASPLSIEKIIAGLSDSEEGDREISLWSGSGSSADDTLSVQDFFLPEGEKAGASAPHYLRPRVSRWSDEQVNRYWIPLEEIALDLVGRENNRSIEQLFEEIP